MNFVQIVAYTIFCHPANPTSTTTPHLPII